MGCGPGGRNRERRKRERIQGDTAKNKVLLRVLWKPNIVEASYKYEGDLNKIVKLCGQTTNWLILSSNEASGSEIGLHLMGLLFRAPGKSPINPDYCQYIHWSRQTENKTSLLKTTPTQLIEVGDAQPVPTQCL